MTADTPSRATRLGAPGQLFRSLRPVAGMLRPYRRWVIGAIVIHAGIHLATIAAAATGALVIGRALSGATAGQLWPLIAAIGGILVPLGILGWLDMYVTHVMSFRMLHDLRLTLYERFHQLAPAYLLHRRSGDVARASVADVELLEIFTSHIAPPLVAALAVPALCLVVLAIINPLLALTAAPFVLLVATVPSWLLERASQQGERLRADLGDLGADVVDTVQGTREILTSGAQALVLERISRRHDRIISTSISHGRRSGLEQAATDALTALAVITTFIVAAALEIHGSISRAALPPAIVLTAGAFAPLLSLSGALREIGPVAAASTRIHLLLEQRPTVLDAAPAGQRPARPGHQHQDVTAAPVPAISFRDVSFRYRPDLPLALRHVSFDVPAEATVALAGHSGAGKSTCASLILRLWDASDGQLLIHGNDVRDLPQDELRSQMGVVPQDIYLFHTTVRDNIRLATPSASDDAIGRAAGYADAGFIARLPDSMDTVIGERGATLSGGQRQRLAIARALIRDAPILILDEAVSNLDTEAEQRLHKALRQAAPDATIVLIAHRPSTMRLADLLVVLDQGEVAETGRFDDLLARDGTLRRLIAESGDAP